MVQNKEARALLTPLISARLVSKHGRQEARVVTSGQSRSLTREYCYINYHEAVDAIKYKIVKLQDKVQGLYKEEEGKRKDWSCPRCFAEYDEYSILDKVDLNTGGFYCERCGTTLIQNEAAVRERGDHAKIRMINDQLIPFNKLLAQIDAGEVPSRDFEDAWATRREPPAKADGSKKAQYMDVQRQREDIRKTQAVVDASALETTIEDEKERFKAEEEAKRVKMEMDAKKNQLPAWHTQSAIGQGVKKEEGGQSPNPLAALKQEEDEKKVLTETQAERDMDDEMAAYMAEMEREARERERKEAEEGSEEDEDEDDFEDIPSSAVGTPASSHQPHVKQESTPASSLRTNGLKRELDEDGDSISGTSTGANTPAHTGPTSMPDVKRVKLENGNAGGVSIKAENAGSATPLPNGTAADSDEDDDFEDV